jgi:uncharacterized protein YbjT (DUF2867 family)
MNQISRVLVLSANSQVGAATTRQLLAKGVSVVAGVRDLEKAQALAQLGAVVVQADLDHPESLGEALAEVDHVLLSTNADPNVAEIHARLYPAAKSAGVRHIVRISAVGASPKAPVRLGRIHGEAERLLEASGLGWTHIRPHSFMQNFFSSIPTIAGQGRMYSCMGEGQVPHVDVRDIAAVAAVCLTQPGHEGKAYEITGPEALTMSEVAARIGSAIGKPVEYVDLPAEAWLSAAVSAGLPGWLAEDLAFLYSKVMAKGLSAQVSAAVRELTGTPGITVTQFANDHAQLFLGR